MARPFPIPMPLSRAEALRAGSRQGTRAVPKLDVVGVGSNPDRRVAHGVALRTRTILHSPYYTACITQPVLHSQLPATSPGTYRLSPGTSVERPRCLLKLLLAGV